MEVERMWIDLTANSWKLSLLNVLSFIYYSLFNTANSENDGCKCDAGYDRKACVQVHFCVLIVSFSEDKHTHIKCAVIEKERETIRISV